MYGRMLLRRGGLVDVHVGRVWCSSHQNNNTGRLLQTPPSVSILQQQQQHTFSFSRRKLSSKMALPKACCTLPPVESNYVPKGTDTTVDGGLIVYETGPADSERLLICVYDIFGFHPITKQFCDKLGSTGFRVVMPDFFRGNPFLLENFPPKDSSEIVNFVGTTGSWDNVVKKDLEQLIGQYKASGTKKIGIFGFCWGGKMCVNSADELSADIGAAVLIHPAFVTTDDADRVKIPTLVVPSKDEADFVPFYEKLKTRFSEGQCGHQRFDDMHHGFAAARGNLEDDLNRQRVDEALKLVHGFFNTNLAL